MKMQMHKLLITDYTVTARVKNDDGVIEEKEVNYKVVDSITMLLFHPDLRLGGKELLEAGKVADKLEDEKQYKKEGKQTFILLSEDDFKRVKHAFDTVKGYGRNELELYKRIDECEEVEVEVEETDENKSTSKGKKKEKKQKK